MKHKLFRAACVAVASCALPALAADPVGSPGLGPPDKAQAEKAHPAKRPYSPYAGRDFPTRPFFGDTHLHTAFPAH
ncbi:MAG TPA: hypothetical protein VIA64_10995 [Burkholderiales bacterium]